MTCVTVKPSSPALHGGSKARGRFVEAAAKSSLRSTLGLGRGGGRCHVQHSPSREGCWWASHLLREPARLRSPACLARWASPPWQDGTATCCATCRGILPDWRPWMMRSSWRCSSRGWSQSRHRQRESSEACMGSGCHLPRCCLIALADAHPASCAGRLVHNTLWHLSVLNLTTQDPHHALSM